MPGIGAPARAAEEAYLQRYSALRRVPPSACHAEGRGFESLQPLPGRPAFAGLFRACSRLMRLLAPDRNRTRGKSTRTFDSKNAAVCRESWLVELLTSCEDDAEGHEFDPSGGPVSVRNRALARAGPTDLQDDRLAPRAGACRRSAQEPLTPPRRQSRDPFREPQATLGGFGRSQPRGRALGSRSRRFRHPHG